MFGEYASDHASVGGGVYVRCGAQSSQGINVIVVIVLVVLVYIVHIVYIFDRIVVV